MNCAPEARYKVLSFFFDGVEQPPGGAKGVEPAVTGPAKEVSQAPVQEASPAPKYYTHKPFEEQSCTQCHDETDSLVVKKKGQELCLECHKDFVKDLPYIHGPLATGSCDACHSAHSSPYEHLLIAKGQNLCLTCHGEEKEKILASEHHEGHLEEECFRCHDPHFSKNKYFLKEGPPLANQTQASPETVGADAK